MLLITADSADATRDVAAAVAGVARSGDVIILSGDLGSGKTVFAQGFGAARGVEEPMTSPTFTLINSYPCGRLTLHHADLYRLERTGEVEDLALAELADMDGIVLIEWGDVVEGAFPEYLHVHLEPSGDVADEWGGRTGREIELEGVGKSWAARWGQLTEAVAPWA